jgi:hypothetical protein
MKILSKSICKTGQSIDYKEILKLDDKKIKITIKSDSYSFQSYARIELWNGEKWNMIDSIPHGNMNTPIELVYQPKNQPGNLTPSILLKNNFCHFEKDRDYLFGMAQEIVMG